MSVAEMERQPQHMAALDRANLVRMRRSEIKRALKAATMKLSEALDDPLTQEMKVYDLLCYLPYYGPSTAPALTRGEKSARKLLHACGATESTLVKNLHSRRARLETAVQEKLKGRV